MQIKSKNITQILNNVTPSCIRWCTPSIDLGFSRVKDPYRSDISISYETLGYPSEPSGIFKEMYKHAAIAYGADNTLFSVNGTTGSNMIVLRSLSKQIPNLRVLAQRNVHTSVVTACKDYGINLMFFSSNIDPNYQVFLPNTEKEIIQGIEKTKPQVLLLTNPTYEGIVLNLKKIVSRIKKQYPDVIIFVEEAWGAHLHFSHKLPISAMDAGADIAVQSTHKHGGSLQQGGMIHWKNGKIDNELLLDSYRSLSTSSPSYIILASLDAAREIMQKKGSQKIDHILSLATYLTDEINKIDGLEVVTTKKLQEKNPSIFGRDETKLIVDVSKTGHTGYEIARHLENEYKIIVEKYNATTILLLVPFQNTIKDVKVTVEALKNIFKNTTKKDKVILTHALDIPKNVPKVLELGEVAKLLQDQIEEIPLREAKGRISAENITPYPPGIPTTMQGEEFTAQAITFYQNLKHYPNSHVLAHDITLETVLVVK